MKNKLQKTLAIILSVGTIGTATFVANARTVTPNTKRIVGDVNLDGSITVKDVTAMQKYLANLSNFPLDMNKAYDYGVADTNNDHKITISDGSEIQKYLSKKGGNHIQNATWVEPETTQVWIEPGERTVWIEPVIEYGWVAPVTKEVTVPATTKKVWVKAKTTTIKHPAVTHEEPVYKEDLRYICNACGADVTDLIIRMNHELVPPEEDHIFQHLLKGEKASWHNEYRMIQTGTKTVVDKKAWTEKKTTPAHYETVTVPATTKTVTVSEGHWKKNVIEEGYWKTETITEGFYETQIVKEGYWK